MRCKGIINLYDKTKFNCSILINDPIQFINFNSKNQNKDEIYLYIFDGSKYFVVNSNKIIIQKVNNSSELAILWSVYGKHTSSTMKNKRINSILKKLKNVNDKYFNQNFSEEELERFFYKLGNNNQIQQGGAAIWAIQESLKSVLPDEGNIALDLILDIIDVALILISTVPGILGLNIFPGLTVMLDLISIIYSVLRLDTIGTVASIIALVPFVGDIIGGMVGIGSKIGKYIELYSNFNKFSDKFIEARKFGYNYGNKYNDIIEFTAEFGDHAMKTVLTVLDFGKDQLNIDRTLEIMRRLTEERLQNIINKVEKEGAITKVAAEFGLFLKYHAIHAVNNGIKDRITETSTLVDNKISEINKNYQAK